MDETSPSEDEMEQIEQSPMTTRPPEQAEINTEPALEVTQVEVSLPFEEVLIEAFGALTTAMAAASGVDSDITSTQKAMKRARDNHTSALNRRTLSTQTLREARDAMVAVLQSWAL